MRVLVARLQAADLPAALLPSLAHAASHWSGLPRDLTEDKVALLRHIEASQPSGSA